MKSNVTFVRWLFRRRTRAFLLAVVVLSLAVLSTIAVLTAMDTFVIHPLGMKDDDHFLALGGLATSAPTGGVSW